MKHIDGLMLKQMIISGANYLFNCYPEVDALNVFPVPDGDTGTNMTLTIMAAAKEVGAMQTYEMDKVAKSISSGSLRGARGNSGVILSQLFRGLCKVIKEEKEIDVPVMAAALQKAVETGYKAVMKPKEGTILTVAKGGAKKAIALADETDDLVYFMQQVVAEMEIVLSKTPEMLPVLKEAGVVDSGGQGLVEVFHGMMDALEGKEREGRACSSVRSTVQPAA